jgi:hypothetical protein
MKILILLFAASLGFAQDQAPKPIPAVGLPQPEAAKEAEIIQVKTLTGDSFERLVKLLGVFGAHMTSDSQMRTIVVYAAKDVVTQIRHVVEQLDRPGSEAAIGKNIEMTLTLLRCSAKPSASTTIALPADIEAVAKQLRAATQYKDIQLLDILPMRLQEGKESIDSIHLPGPAAGQPITGDVRFYPQSVYRKDQARYVRFDSVRLNLRIPVAYGNPPSGYNFLSEGLNTSGDFMEGQKTVLGKVSGMSDDDAIFAVIALKVLD